MDKDDGRELCDSCGEDNLSARDHLCRGCGLIVCQQCVDVFNHSGAGLHGKGDPSEAVISLRSQLTTQAERIRELEMENERMKRALEGIRTVCCTPAPESAYHYLVSSEAYQSGYSIACDLIDPIRMEGMYQECDDDRAATPPRTGTGDEPTNP